MAGTNPAFDAAAFRTAIKATFQMALPDPGPAFHWNPAPDAAATYSRDSSGVPFNPTAVESFTVLKTSVVGLSVGLECFDAQDILTPFGLLPPSKIVITVFDDDHAQIHDADYLLLAGERYNYRHTMPPTALFNVSQYRMVFVRTGEA
jgi:hypothetical protein